MTTESIGIDDIDAAIESVVAEYGTDYKYSHSREFGCVYYAPVTRKPMCLVGHVLERFGLLDEITEEENTEGIDKIGFELPIPTDAVYPLARAQAKQDDGFTWGEALEAYRATRDESHE